MASKSTDVRPKITLACTECKERNYITKKNRRNDPDRMELKKFCPRCRKHTAAPRDPLTSALVRRPVRPPDGSFVVCPLVEADAATVTDLMTVRRSPGP